MLIEIELKKLQRKINKLRTQLDLIRLSYVTGYYKSEQNANWS